MSWIDNLKQNILEGQELYSTVATVKSVDSQKRVCEAVPIDGTATLFDVKMQANESQTNGFLVIPKVGSKVIVTFMNQTSAFLSLCAEIDSFEVILGEKSIKLTSDGLVLNGGNNGGLIVIEMLIKELGKLQAYTQAIGNAIIGTSIVQGDGGATLKTTVTNALTSKTVGNFSSSNMENQNVKH